MRFLNSCAKSLHSNCRFWKFIILNCEGTNKNAMVDHKGVRGARGM